MELMKMKKAELVEIIELNELMHEAQIDNARFEYKKMMGAYRTNTTIMWEMAERLLTVARTTYLITKGIDEADALIQEGEENSTLIIIDKKVIKGRLDFLKGMAYRALDNRKMTEETKKRTAEKKARIEAQVAESRLVQTEVIS